MSSKERWVKVDGYDGYMVSDFGRVRSFKTCNYGNIMAQTKDACGYVRVGLCKDNKQVKKSIHRLVAAAFLPIVDGKDQVNHKNGEKTDNRPANLEWCTRKENSIHSVMSGLHKTKLSPAEVIEIRAKAGTKSQYALARDYGVSQGAIWGIIVRKTWRHLE